MHTVIGLPTHHGFPDNSQQAFHLPMNLTPQES